MGGSPEQASAIATRLRIGEPRSRVRHKLEQEGIDALSRKHDAAACNRYIAWTSPIALFVGTIFMISG